MLKEYIEKVEKEFDKQFTDGYGFCKNEYLLRDGNKHLLGETKAFIRQSIIGAVGEMGEQMLKTGEERDLQNSAYKGNESFGVLRTRDIPVWVEPYRSAIKDVIDEILKEIN